MVNQAGLIPAFRNITLMPAGPLSRSVAQWIAAGKTYDWQMAKMPSGFGMSLGPIYELLANGTFTTDEFEATMKNQIAAISN